MPRYIDAERLLDGLYYAACIDDDFSLDELDRIEVFIEGQPSISVKRIRKERLTMLKFLGKTIAGAAKLCAFCVVVNELAYLDHEVRELKREVDKLSKST